MNFGKRFVAWSLVGILLTVGFSSCGPGSRGGYAATPAEMAETVRPMPGATVSSADELEPEPPPDTPPEPDDGTLNLPDFEPQLPSERLPETAAEDAPIEGAPSSDEMTETPADPDDDWDDAQVESSEADAETPKISKQQQILMAADEHYLNGDRETAEALYRQVKDDLWQVNPEELRPEPIFDPAELPPAGAVYWREAQAGYERGLTHRTLVPLELLLEEYPEFIPAQIFYASYLVESDRAAEADALLDRSLMLYPSQPDLLRARTETQMAMEQWIEAAITAKQFALLNPDHPDRDAMEMLSEENLDRFRGEMNEQLTQNLISNVITGTAGLLLTGGLIGPYTALNSAMLLMQGESAVGANAAEQIQAQIPMMSDRQVEEYLNRIGQELASLTGRDEFDYDFYVVEDADLNAFALPGGKIFVNAGAILQTQSEAEIAGLLAHEISHAVLSHGFQMVTNGNFINSIASIIPIPEVGGIAAGLAFSSYSREMERQADILGTQILSAAGYAADGLHNLMVTLQAEVGDRGGIQWFASHPAPTERVDYLQQIVEIGGFNRYAYEGVEPHLAIQQRVQRLMDAAVEAEG